MPLEIKPWDAAELLTSEARIEGYLREAMAFDDPAMTRLARNAVARARRRLRRKAAKARRAP